MQALTSHCFNAIETTRKFKISINNKIINKVDSTDKKQLRVLTEEFSNLELTIKEIAGQISFGHPFCAQHKGRRKSANFIRSDVLAVDIDEGMLISEAMAHPFVRDHAAIVYTTPSHTDEFHKFRIVLVLDSTITDAQKMRLANAGLIRKFGGDKACKDVCRVFYGSKDSTPTILGNVLPAAELNSLIELGSEAVVKESIGAENERQAVTRRSNIAINLDQLVTTAVGLTIPLRDVPIKTQIHCPIHVDNNPSAFVLESKDKIKGVYCSGCAATFWSSSKSGRPVKDYDFYKIEDIIMADEHHDEPDTYYDDDVPPGLLKALKEERSCYTMDLKYLPNLPFDEGLTFVRSPKGSGKTEWLIKVVKRCRAENKSVLLVGHRTTLIQSMAKRLGLTCYFYSDDNKIRNRLPTAYYAVSVDSISKLLEPTHDKYDVVIIDESEQVFSHLTSSTLKSRRRSCYMMLFHYLAAAKSVIVADADLGPITIEGLFQAVDKNSAYVFYLNRFSAKRCNYQNYSSDSHLLQDMLDAICAGGRHYVATNSITKAKELREAIKSQSGYAKRIMLVTSEVSGSAEVREFISNIKTEILNYDVIIASPSLGTGIDISFDNDAQYIDTVFGFFGARVNTHFDIDQQIARVRNPKSLKIWISPEQFNFETEPDVIGREARKNGTLNDILIGYERETGEAKLDATYLGVYAHVVSISRASKNKLRKNLLDLRVRNGWTVIDISTDIARAETGKELKKFSKETVEKMRIEEICCAPKINEEEYEKLNGKNYVPNMIEQTTMRRYEVERFYMQDVSNTLLSLDDNGAYRKKIRLLTTYLSHESDLANFDKNRFELKAIVTDTEKKALKQKLLRSLFVSAGIADESHPIKIDVIFQSADLRFFIDVCRKHALQLQDLFAVAIRRDLETKPVSQLGQILKLIGLTLKEIETQKVDKKKLRFYKVNEDDWGVATQYAKRRTAGLKTKPDILNY